MHNSSGVNAKQEACADHLSTRFAISLQVVDISRYLQLARFLIKLEEMLACSSS
jgi:hypothetical protein